MINKYSSSYNKDIIVLEDDNIVELIFGNGWGSQQSKIDTNDLALHIYDYTRLAMYSLSFLNRTPKNVLVVGLGGGVIPRETLRYVPDVEIDVIELDPLVVDLAKRYFYYDDKNIHTYVGDAFTEINNLNKTYDIIVLDACNSNFIPFTLMCKEFFEKVKLAIKPNGIITFNTCNSHPSFFNQINTLYTVFGDKIYRLDGIKNTFSTTLYICDTVNFNDRLPSVYYPLVVLNKVDISEEIKTSKIFEITT